MRGVCQVEGWGIDTGRGVGMGPRSGGGLIGWAAQMLRATWYVRII